MNQSNESQQIFFFRIKLAQRLLRGRDIKYGKVHSQKTVIAQIQYKNHHSEGMVKGSEKRGLNQHFKN